jgi:hypothetical protein
MMAPRRRNSHEDIDMNRTRVAGGLLAAGLLLSACGSGSGEADKTADQILADASSALKAAKSFHFELTEAGASSSSNGGFGNLSVAMDVVAGQGASATLKGESVSANLVITGGKVYLQGRNFWAKFAGAQAANVIGERWVILPSSVSGLSDLLMFTDTAKLANCLRLDHGTLSRSGTATVAGQSAVVLADKGDKPGTAPGKLYVATSGTAYPLKIESSGNGRPGAPPGGDACSSSSPASETGSRASSTVLFSEFGQSFTIKPPSGALDLQSLMNGGG